MEAFSPRFAADLIQSRFLLHRKHITSKL